METVVAGVELGGTKAIALIGQGRQSLARVTIATTTPTETLATLCDTLVRWEPRYRPEALGIGSFGPIDLDRASPGYGRMLATPKDGWTGTDIVGALTGAVAGPIALHTDVTAAALAEGRWGGAQGLSDYIYITIGTGIGMGIVAGGQPVSGRMHPECGHLRVRRWAEDSFAGVCPFHGDCLEGLVSGPAISTRFGAPATQVNPADPRWRPVADALAEALAMLMLTLSPQAILVGGGVGLGQPHLLNLARQALPGKLNGYLPGMDDATLGGIVRPAALGADAGPLGTLALATRALAATVKKPSH